MKILNSLRSLLAGKADDPEKTCSDDTQYPSSGTRPDRQGFGNYHHITAQEEQRRTAEQRYWGEQLRVAKKLNRLTRRQNLIMVWGTVATLLNLFLLWRTLVVTIHNAHEDKRAWIGVSGTKPLGEMIPGEPFRVRIKFKNVGNSPGLYVDTQAYVSPVIGVRVVMKKVPFMDLSLLPTCIQPKPRWGERTNGSFVLPGKEHMWMDQPTAYPMNETTIKFVKGKEYDDPAVSQEELERFPIMMRIGPKDLGDPNKRKRVGLYLVGCINYFDEFRDPHRTNFCFRYEHAIEEKDRFFSMCEYGNDAE